jgi:hypothetical protein
MSRRAKVDQSRSRRASGRFAPRSRQRLLARAVQCGPAVRATRRSRRSFLVLRVTKPFSALSQTDFAGRRVTFDPGTLHLVFPAPPRCARVTRRLSLRRSPDRERGVEPSYSRSSSRTIHRVSSNAAPRAAEPFSRR